MDPIYFRLANINDCEDLYKVQVGSLQGACSIPGGYSKEEIKVLVGLQSVNQYVDPVNRGRVIVACQSSDSGVVGFTYYDFVDEEVLEIKKLYVSSDCVGCGIGSLLMQRIKRLVDKNGHVKKMIVTSSVNAVKFYEKHGFVVDQEVVYATCDHVSVNCIKMSKN